MAHLGPVRLEGGTQRLDSESLGLQAPLPPSCACSIAWLLSPISILEAEASGPDQEG